MKQKSIFQLHNVNITNIICPYVQMHNFQKHFSFLFFLQGRISENHELKVRFAPLLDLINHLESRSAGDSGSAGVVPCVRGRQGSPTLTEKEKFFNTSLRPAVLLWKTVFHRLEKTSFFLDCSITHTNSKAAKSPARMQMSPELHLLTLLTLLTPSSTSPSSSSAAVSVSCLSKPHTHQRFGAV